MEFVFVLGGVEVKKINVVFFFIRIEDLCLWNNYFCWNMLILEKLK